MPNRAPRNHIERGVFSYQLADGTTLYGARWRQADGKTKEQLGFKTKTKARDHRDLMRAEAVNGVVRDDARLTFAAWHERWWKAKRSTIETNTQLQYESLLRNHVIPVLGGRRIGAIRRIDIEELVGVLTAPRPGETAPPGCHWLAPSTVSTARKLVGMILQSAVDNNVVPANVARGVRVARQVDTPKHALTVAEVERLAMAVPDVYRVLVLVLAYAGLRPGEAAALQRRDLDQLGRLHVRATVTEPRGRLERREATKTYQRRTVPLGPGVLGELEAHLVERVAGEADAPIFTSERGRPFRLSNFRRAIDQAVDRANVAAVLAGLAALHGAPVAPSSLEGLPRWITPYTLRHTCASLLAQRGLSVHVAAAFMGHDPAEYLRTYVHLYQGDLEAAAAALAGAREDGLADVVPISAARRAAV